MPTAAAATFLQPKSVRLVFDDKFFGYDVLIIDRNGVKINSRLVVGNGNLHL
jgi:hypothetical protein